MTNKNAYLVDATLTYKSQYYVLADNASEALEQAGEIADRGEVDHFHEEDFEIELGDVERDI